MCPLQVASAGFGTEQLAAVVEKAVPGGRLLRAAAAEVVFRLPLASASTFPQVRGELLLQAPRQHYHQVSSHSTTMHTASLKLHPSSNA